MQDFLTSPLWTDALLPTLTVVGKDTQGGTVAASLDIKGEVTGVELENGEPVLKIGDVVRIKLSDVKSLVKEDETPPPPNDDDDPPAET